MRNNMTLNSKKKSKFSTIEFDPNNNTISILPYGLEKQ